VNYIGRYLAGRERTGFVARREWRLSLTGDAPASYKAKRQPGDRRAATATKRIAANYSEQLNRDVAI